MHYKTTRVNKSLAQRPPKFCKSCGKELVITTLFAYRQRVYCNATCRDADKIVAQHRNSTTMDETKVLVSGLDGSPVLKEMAARLLARRSLIFFTKKTHPRYQAGWVHKDICHRLERFSQQVAAGENPRLMLLMPPRHGKSELASIRFPAWHLGHHPEHELISVSYNLDLPMIFSRRVRELLRDPLYSSIFAETKLDPESQSVEKWSTTMGGGMMAAGVGGGITGKGAHILLIDDPIKNIEEADSILTRDALWEWYLSTAYPRLAPGGGVLLIETWWNDDDLAGRIQQAAQNDPLSDKFEVVKYPAIAEEDEWRHPETYEVYRGKDQPAEFELVRKKGEALHPERYDDKALARIKAVQTPRIWSALYQQNPVPDEGAYFRKEYFQYEAVPPDTKNRRLYTAWDFAVGQKQQNDWTVGATILQDETDTLHVLEIMRIKGDSFTIVEAIMNCWERWPGLLGFEDGQIFKAIEPLLKKRMQERKQYPSYEVMKPLTDKLVRARPLQGRMQQGKVVFLKEAEWLAQARQELMRFPAGAHDDVVDALAWAVRLTMGKAPPLPEKPFRAPSWKDKLDVALMDGSHMSA